MKKKLPKYIIDIIQKFPKILSGRKNYIDHHERVCKNLLLTKKYFKDYGVGKLYEK